MLPAEIRQRLRQAAHAGVVALAGGALAYIVVTIATLYFYGARQDLTRALNERVLDSILAHRPRTSLVVLAGMIVALGLSLIGQPKPWSQRLRRINRMLGWGIAAGVVVSLLFVLSPHARVAAAMFLTALGALVGAWFGSAAQRGNSVWIDRLVLWAIFLGSSAIYFLYSYTRHANFGSGSWDYGCYNHSVWLASRFEPLMSTVLGGVHVIGDHWIPIVWVLSPVFWITDSSSALLLVQALLLASTIFPMVWLARHKGLGRFLAFAIGVSLLFTRAAQDSIIFDFHETTISLCFFAYAFYFIETDRIWRALPFLFLLFLCKETMPLVIAFLGIYVAVFRRRRWFGLALFVFGFASFFLIVQWVMPAILAATKSKAPAFSPMQFQQFGKSFSQALVNMASDPLRTVAIGLTPALKVQTLLYTFGTFVFLGFLAPKVLVLAIPLIAERFLTTKQTLWGLGYHYGGPLTLIAGIAAIYGAVHARAPLARLWERLSGRFPSPVEVGGFLGAACLLATFLIGGWGPGQPAAFAHLHQPYFSKQVAANRRAVEKIPAGVSVAAQNHFVPHVAMRKEIWLLHRPIRAEYVIANPADGAWPFNRGYVIGLLRSLLRVGYRPIFSERTAIVLRRSAPQAVALSPEMRSLLGM